MSKKRRDQATPEEQEMMKRAEAKAAGIGTEPSTGGYTFDEKKEAERAIEANKPGVTIVEGAESGMPGQKLNEELATQKTTTFSPTQVANSAVLQKVLNDDNANIASNAILAEGSKKAESLGELEQVKADADAARDLEEIEKNKLQSEIYSGPGASNVNLAPNATSTYLQDIGQEPGKPSYVGGTATKDKIEKDIVDSYSAMDSQVPQTVVDKLGVQDYYPQAGRDVAVGTFTGSRIGSQTIYSGAGALLPMGLYDARKRALAGAAKEKQAAVDKYFDIIDTAPQYQEKFNTDTFDFMNNKLQQYKGDYNSFLKDPEVRREYSRRKGLAKELTHYSGWSDSLLKDASEEKKYVTKDMIETAGQIKSALVNNADDIVSGKQDLGSLFAKAQVYQNIIPQIDNITKEVLSADRLGRNPINLRTGGEYDSEKFKNEANEFIQKVSTGDIDRDGFITGFKKHFTGDYERIIDGLIGSGKYSEEQREAAIDYFAGQMQDQNIFENKLLANEKRERSEDARRQRRWQSEFDEKKAQGKGYWDIVNEQMNFKDESSGKSMNNLIEGWKSQGLSSSQIQNKMLETARNNGIKNAYINPYTKSVVISMQPSKTEAELIQPVNTSSASLMVKERVWSNKSKKWVYEQKSIKYNDFVELKTLKTKDGKSKYLFENDEKVTPETLREYRDLSRGNKVFLKANEIQASYGLMNDKTKNIETLNASNINQFSSNKAVNFKRTVGVAGGKVPIYEEDGVTQKKDPDTGQPLYDFRPMPGRIYINNEITSERGRAPLNTIYGMKEKSIGLGEEYIQVSEGNSSGSSSSDEE